MLRAGVTYGGFLKRERRRDALGREGEVLWAQGTACTKEARSQGSPTWERRVGGEVWSVRASCAWYNGALGRGNQVMVTRSEP